MHVARYGKIRRKPFYSRAAVNCTFILCLTVLSQNMVYSKQSSWFVRKVIYWRAAASIAWAVVLMPNAAAVFVILSGFSPLHPIQMMSECLSHFTSANSIMYLILLCLVTGLVGFLNFKSYTVIPTIAVSKVALLGQLLHPRQLLSALLHCGMGVVVAWCCATTSGTRYTSLGYTCPQSDGDIGTQVCLNEYYFILLLGGAFAGFSYSLLGVVHNMNYVSFSTVQQYKYFHVKGSVLVVLRGSATLALFTVRNFTVLYLFLGHIPKAWLCKTWNLHSNSPIHSIDSITGLLDLFYHLWLSTTFLLFTWHFTLLLFRIFVTEVYSFPLQPTFTDDANECLPKVLTDNHPSIVKYLALQDLALLSQHSPSRRTEVFSLSQPGGHPHNWNAISQECLSLLTDLTQRLVVYHDTVATNGRPKSLSQGSERKTSSDKSLSSGTEDLFSPRAASVFPRSVAGTPQTPQAPLTVPFTPDLNSPFAFPAMRRLTAPAEQHSPTFSTVQSPHFLRRGPKLWSTSTDSLVNGSPQLSPTSVTSSKQEPFKPSLLAQFVQSRKEQVKQFLMRRVLIMYLFNKLPEASSQALFADSQAHIWALEGLSYLVQASFSEDQYGVVQTTLPRILSCMLVLQEAVDRHFKLPHASSKPSRLSSSMEDSSHKTLRFALRATLKTAIYRITTTFGDHLNDVAMSAEHRKRLQQFLDFKE